MVDEKERLATAQWVLERQLAWISAAEVKVAVVITIDTAMFGGLAAAYAGTSEHSKAVIIACVLYVIASIVALTSAAMAVFPRLDGPPDSLLFFGKIAERGVTDYCQKFATATDAELLDDWSRQIHRNAEISAIKHKFVKQSVKWSFFSAPFWTLAVALLVKL